MTVCTPIITCSKNVVCLIGNAHKQMNIRVSNSFMQSSCNYYVTFGKQPRLPYNTNGFRACQKNYSNTPSCHSLTFRRLIRPSPYRNTHVNVSTGYHDMDLKFLMAKQSQTSKIKCNVGPFSLKQRSLSAGVFIGLLVCFSTSQTSYAEAHEGNEKREGYCDATSGDYSHNKKVLTDYSVIGIPGDGRCLFRSVAHGACIRSGKPTPNENLQRELADELRDKVADEFIKRRKETEWFIEGDFETYVTKIRKPHVWGGEPELLMASHVLQMPITVYMHDQDSGGLISIAEYGQEYGKDSPIKVLYHGYGHYDALHISNKGGARPRL